ncbi:hypothetical protein GT348_09000 (plasmid) [Aristophania vespae]|uniref:DUF4136 domain-containing protein n=1 Tax=Aristophania vespae TaxID=2697033 RepID=A0A6P1NCU9_9PROT|nr:hypothetical protein [Aristophania vespae]QHI96485.1 hypothetical protein GT348_09000 [Aristophania vespae]UMM64829.1 hypothetical protein DM15PD_18490 [Aristophania vespae]
MVYNWKNGSNFSLFCIFLAISGCAPAKSYLDKGLVLARAGFVAHYADTTARYTMMNYLPPGKLTFRPGPYNNKIFLYADPIGCSCVYMGNEAAYDNLTKFVDNHKKKSKYKRYEASLESMIVENRQNSTTWDWSAWSHSADPGSNQPKYMIGNSW